MGQVATPLRRIVAKPLLHAAMVVEHQHPPARPLRSQAALVQAERFEEGKSGRFRVSSCRGGASCDNSLLDA
jgi:hypothetical protein